MSRSDGRRWSPNFRGTESFATTPADEKKTKATVGPTGSPPATPEKNGAEWRGKAYPEITAPAGGDTLKDTLFLLEMDVRRLKKDHPELDDDSGR